MNQYTGRGKNHAGWSGRAKGSKNANTATSQRVHGAAANKSAWNQQFRKDVATSQRIHGDAATRRADGKFRKDQKPSKPRLDKQTRKYECLQEGCIDPDTMRPRRRASTSEQKKPRLECACRGKKTNPNGRSLYKDHTKWKLITS